MVRRCFIVLQAKSKGVSHPEILRGGGCNAAGNIWCITLPIAGECSKESLELSQHAGSSAPNALLVATSQPVDQTPTKRGVSTRAIGRLPMATCMIKLSYRRHLPASWFPCRSVPSLLYICGVGTVTTTGCNIGSCSPPQPTQALWAQFVNVAAILQALDLDRHIRSYDTKEDRPHCARNYLCRANLQSQTSFFPLVDLRSQRENPRRQREEKESSPIHAACSMREYQLQSPKTAYTL